MARRQRPRVTKALLAGLVLLLSACSTVVPPARPPVAAPIAPAPAPPTKPQTGLPEDEARHRVALLVPLSGPNAAVGQSIANAAALALVDTGGKDLRVTNYDTAGGALVAAQRALADGNRLFLGPLLADDVRQVTAVAEGAGVPVIAFSNDAAAAGRGVWLLGFSPAQSIERVVRYARARGLTSFAALVPQGVYGRGAANTLLRAADAAGGRVVAMQSYDRSAKSITTAVSLLAKQKFDAVLIADSGRVAIAAAPAIRARVGGARLLGTELWNAEPGLNAAGAVAGGWYASVDDAMFEQLVPRYRARFGRTPYRLASLGYDAVLLTVRIARDWKVGDRFPAERLADDGGFSGVDGAFRFGDEHVAQRALAVHQLGAGGGTIVSAAPRGFRD